MGGSSSGPSRLDPFVEWRDQDWRATIRCMQRKLSSCCQGELLRIVICGERAAGKSSLVNNIVSAFKEKLVSIANVGDNHADSVTKKYTEYVIKFDNCDNEEPLIVICDTEGVGPNGAEEQVEAVKGVLEGKFYSTQKMNSLQAGSDANKKKAVYIIMVRDATLQTPGAQPSTSLRAIQRYANSEGITMSIFLTKCDKLDQAVGRNVEMLYKSESVQKAVHLTSAMFDGFNESRIFPIVNYKDQRSATPPMILQTLYAMNEIIGDVETYMGTVMNEN